MITIENTEITGLEAALRGMRNPMNSWERSDSAPCGEYVRRHSIQCHCEGCDHDPEAKKYFVLGEADRDLMLRLARQGPVHGKFRRMIVVYADITAPLYWWKEFDTYKVGTVANSCSTMHKIHGKELAADDFSHERLMSSPEKAGLMLVDEAGKELGVWITPLSLLNTVTACLNEYREKFLETGDETWWWQMIQLLPSSYNQRRTIMLNYEVLANIYRHRRGHKLDEWRSLCRWIEELPYSEVITGDDEKDGKP